MNSKPEAVFHEVQRFAWWFYLAVFTSIPMSIGAVIFGVMAGNKQGQTPIPPGVVAIIIVMLLTGASLVLSMKLEIQVCRDDGLYVRFFPLHIRYKKFCPENLSDCYARSYSPIFEYGGWGIKFGKNGKGLQRKGQPGGSACFENG